VAADAGAAAEAKAKEAAAKAKAEEKEKEGNNATVTIKVPEGKVGQVIGPKGSKIKLIQEKTGCRIDTTGEFFTITGPPETIDIAKAAVEDLKEKGYMKLEYEDFAEEFVAVHPSVFPDLIGKQGSVIRQIKDKLDVTVQIPQNVPKDAAAGKKYKVTLAGSRESVDKAKEVVNDIVLYYHHPLTHADQVHAEMEVKEEMYRFLIGRAGSELRHIQNNYKVRLNIPREFSANKNVVIVGDESDVDRSKAYIEKLLYNAEHAPKGRDKAENEGGDHWGEEGGEEEAWMKSYIVKRP